MAHKLAAVLPASHRPKVRNAETGLRKLMLGRSDLYVDFADIVARCWSGPTSAMPASAP
jgi:hypothetical protein